MTAATKQAFEAEMQRQRSQVGRWMAAAILILSVLDWALTKVALEHGGTEVNPLMAWMFEQGAGAPLAIKVLLPLGIWWAAYKSGYPRIVLGILGFLLFLSTAVIINNVLAIAAL